MRCVNRQDSAAMFWSGLAKSSLPLCMMKKPSITVTKACDGGTTSALRRIMAALASGLQNSCAHQAIVSIAACAEGSAGSGEGDGINENGELNCRCQFYFGDAIFFWLEKLIAAYFFLREKKIVVDAP